MAQPPRQTGLIWLTVSCLAVLLMAVAGLWAAGRWPFIRGAPARPEPPELPAVPAPAVPPAGPFDLILAGGTVFDGTGAPGRQADVAINGDRIVHVGDLTGAAGPHVDVTGLAVTPGFINPHSHTYEYDDIPALASVQQGITTEIGGVDGRHHGDLQPRPLEIAAALAWLEQRGTGVNQGLFAGFGTIRSQAVTGADPATPGQLQQMRTLMARAMADGAFGLSTGLEYTPDRDVPLAEISALARVAATAGGVYDTHVRHEGRNILAGIEEAIQISRAAEIPTAIAHLKFVGPVNWPHFAAAIARLQEAAGASPPVVVNFYPYLAPDYATGRPLQQLLQVWELPEHTYLRAPRFGDRSVAALAAAEGVDVATFAARYADRPAVTEVLRPEHVTALLRLPFAFVSTDDQAQPRLPAGDAAYRVHPRGWGAFPLALQRAREQGIPLPDLIRRMTGAVADFLHIAGRGYVRAGTFADLVVLDASTVAARADWWQPQEPPAGIVHVLVNGSFAVRDGRPTGAVPGRALRRGREG